MKSNFKIIATAIIAIAIGLGAGYLIFGNNPVNPYVADVHEHAAETTADPKGEEIWTCSMDPQVRQNEPGDCPICGMDLILLEANTSNDPLVLEMTSESVKIGQYSNHYNRRNYWRIWKNNTAIRKNST